MRDISIVIIDIILILVITYVVITCIVVGGDPGISPMSPFPSDVPNVTETFQDTGSIITVRFIFKKNELVCYLLDNNMYREDMIDALLKTLPPEAIADTCAKYRPFVIDQQLNSLPQSFIQTLQDRIRDYRLKRGNDVSVHVHVQADKNCPYGLIYDLYHLREILELEDIYFDANVR